MSETNIESEFKGSHKNGKIHYHDGGLISVKYSNDSCEISNGISLLLDRETDSNLTTPHGMIKFKTKLTEMTIAVDHIIMKYDLKVDGELIDIRKVTYRWDNEN